jgi:hypothetical protein
MLQTTSASSVENRIALPEMNTVQLPIDMFTSTNVIPNEIDTRAKDPYILDPFLQNMDKLKQLGFVDQSKNEKLLKQHRNNIVITLKALVQDREVQTSKKEVIARKSLEEVTYYKVHLSRFSPSVQSVEITNESDMSTYNAMVSHVYPTSLEDESGAYTLYLRKRSMHLHQTYDVKVNGLRVARCQERFNNFRKNRKFNTDCSQDKNSR